MKIDDAMETIAKFFNDLIGALVPGMVFAMGLSVEHFGPDTTLALVKSMDSTALLLASLAVMFAMGHLLAAIFETCSSFRASAMEHLPDSLRGKLPAAFRMHQGFDRAGAEERESYKDFREIMRHARANSEPPAEGEAYWSYNDLRNVALSVSSEAAAVGRRFMFGSLLCNGVGTAMLLLTTDFMGCLIWQPRLLHTYPVAMNAEVQVVLLVLAAAALFSRGKEFYRRAMTTPFAIAVAEKRLKETARSST